MLSLAYRIASMKTRYRPGTDALLDAESRLIRDVPKFNASNIWDFCRNKYKDDEVSTDDIPNWSPPFEAFWCEWNLPRLDQERTSMLQGGAFTISTEIKTDADREHAQSLAGETLLHQDVRWHLCTSSWLCAARTELKGVPIFTGLREIIFVRGDGHLDFMLLATLGDKGHIDLVRQHQTTILILGFLISFTHCKNVRQAEAKEDAGDRWHRQYKIPRYTYRTLVIDPMKEVLRREGKSEETGLKRALHICRGHFASYTEEKPLFGKIPGTFWIPDHVRGTKEAGEVVKDYDVKPSAVATDAEKR